MPNTPYSGDYVDFKAESTNLTQISLNTELN